MKFLYDVQLINEISFCGLLIIMGKYLKTWYEGNSEIGAHLRGNLCLLFCFKTFMKIESSHRSDFCLQEDLVFFIRVKHVMSCHLI